MTNNINNYNNSEERARTADIVGIKKNSNRAMPATHAGLKGSVTVTKNKGRFDEQIICKDHPNLVTTAMFNEIFRIMYREDTIGAGAFKYIGLSSNTDDAITAGLTELAEEIGTGSITANGLARALGAITFTDDQDNITISKEFESEGVHTAVIRAALFNVATPGATGEIMGHIDVFPGASPAVNLGNDDTLTVTWTITIT